MFFDLTVRWFKLTARLRASTFVHAGLAIHLQGDDGRKSSRSLCTIDSLFHNTTVLGIDVDDDQTDARLVKVFCVVSAKSDHLQEKNDHKPL